MFQAKLSVIGMFLTIWDSSKKIENSDCWICNVYPFCCIFFYWKYYSINSNSSPNSQVRSSDIRTLFLVSYFLKIIRLHFNKVSNQSKKPFKEVRIYVSLTD